MIYRGACTFLHYLPVHRLEQMNHADAVRTLSSQEGTIKLEVEFVAPEDDDDDTSLGDDPYGFK